MHAHWRVADDAAGKGSAKGGCGKERHVSQPARSPGADSAAWRGQPRWLEQTVQVPCKSKAERSGALCSHEGRAPNAWFLRLATCDGGRDPEAACRPSRPAARRRPQAGHMSHVSDYSITVVEGLGAGLALGHRLGVYGTRH